MSSSSSYDPLSVSISAVVTTVFEPTLVEFTSVVGGSGPFSYAWDFRDGGSSGDPNPTHRYEQDGNYYVTLTVGDSHGQSETAQVLVQVAPFEIADIYPPSYAGHAPLEMTFFTSPHGGEPPFSCAWDFGDGGTSTTTSPTSGSIFVSHTYTTPGTYYPGVTVTDSQGRTASSGPSYGIEVYPTSSSSSSSSSSSGGLPPGGTVPEERGQDECGCGCGKCSRGGGDVCPATNTVRAPVPALPSTVGPVAPQYASILYRDGVPTVSRGPYGNNRLDAATPSLVQPEPGVVVAVFDTEKAYWFEETPTGLTPRHGGRQGLAYDATADRYTLTRADGSKVRFDGEGHFQGTASPDGTTRTEVVAYHASGHPSRVDRVVTHGGVTTTDSNVYAFVSGGDNDGLVASVTFQRATSPPVGIRRVVYSYYEAGDAGGNPGDLAAATIQLLVGTTWTDLETSHYRYYKPGETGGFPSGLKYELGPAAFARLAADPAVSDPLTASDSKVAEYADAYYEYDAQQRATKAVTRAGLLTSTYAYDANPSADAPNDWRYKSIETRPDGSTLTTYSNVVQRPLLTELRDGTDTWLEAWRYDADYHEVLHAHPSAVLGYDDAEDDLAIELAEDAGLIEWTSYHASTTATETVPGGAKGYRHAWGVKEGSEGDPIAVGSTSYYARTAGGATIYPVASSTVYRDEAGLDPATTGYAYTWHGGTLQMASRMTTLPVVGLDQNGTGLAETTTELFDEEGRPTWVRDARGYLSYRETDPVTGAVVRQIQDVDDTVVTVPTGWSTPEGGGLHLVTDYEHDALGQITQVLGPAHDVDGTPVRTASWTVHKDSGDEVLSGQGYATGTGSTVSYTLVNPVSIRRTSGGGLITDSIVAVRGGKYVPSGPDEAVPAGTVESSGRLSASDSFPQSSWVRWSRTFTDKHGLTTASRAYFTIPATGEGTPGTHYDESTYGHDATGRQNRSVTPAGTISRTVFDVRGHAVSSWTGTDDADATDADPTGGSATGNDMVIVSESEYDGGQTGGDGLLTQSTAHVDATTTRVTAYEHDFRGRQVVVDGELDAWQQTYYDNQGRVVKTERRDTGPTGNLIARSETAHDDRGRVYRATTYAVDPSTGVAGVALIDETVHDTAGNAVERRPAGSQAVTWTAYDGVGRTVSQATGYRLGPSAWDASSSSEEEGPAGEVIFEERHTAYDAAGHVLLTMTKQRHHDATGTGPLNGPAGAQPRSRDSYVATWHDGLGRAVAAANYGTNADAGPPTRPASPPASSDTVLVSATAYNERGEAFESVDPAGKVDRRYADDAGRQVLTIENFVPEADSAPEDLYAPGNGQNVVVGRAYTSGLMTALTAKNPETGDQVTAYAYGVTLAGSDLASNDVLRAEAYPDSTGPTDAVRYTVNRQGQRTSLTDQNGTVHTYGYDALGRLTADIVATLGAGVDGAVRRIGRTYEVRGMVETVTSYSDTSGTTVVNEVLNVYNDFGQLVAQYQEHGGEVDPGTTPVVEYGYADGLENTTRLESMTYPDGRVLEYRYDDEAADKLSRVRTLRWDGEDVCRYAYLGLGTFVTTDYLEPEVKLDYAESDYAGLDRFDRVVDLHWQKYGTPPSSSSESDPAGDSLVHLAYSYDRASSRTFRRDLVATAYGKSFDELYGYDGMHRLATFDRGVLNTAGTAITSPTFQQGWDLDATGNWAGFTQADAADGSNDLVQARQANAVNEITAITRTVGADWATPEYDAVGNMTVIPQPRDMTATYRATWDAWNRLVRLEEPDGASGWRALQENAYDGQAWRIIVKAYSASTLDEIRHTYFTNLWQAAEERLGTLPSTTEAESQYIWGQRYIDEFVLRDADPNSSVLPERFYAGVDANWDLICIFSSDGGDVTRFASTTYGLTEALTSAYTPDPSNREWSRELASRISDRLGMRLLRFRYLNPTCGCFASRDPGIYDDGYHLYEYAGGRPSTFTDPMGTRKVCCAFRTGWVIAEYFEEEIDCCEEGGAGALSCCESYGQAWFRLYKTTGSFDGSCAAKAVSSEYASAIKSCEDGCAKAYPLQGQSWYQSYLYTRCIVDCNDGGRVKEVADCWDKCMLNGLGYIAGGAGGHVGGAHFPIFKAEFLRWGNSPWMTLYGLTQRPLAWLSKFNNPASNACYRYIYEPFFNWHNRISLQRLGGFGKAGAIGRSGIHSALAIGAALSVYCSAKCSSRS